MFHRYCRHIWHNFVDLCWFNALFTLFIIVHRYRTDIVSALCAWNLVCTISIQHHVYIVYIYYLVNIVNMSFDIESTSCRHRVPLITLFTLISNVDIAMLNDIELTSYIVLTLITLLTSFTSQSCTMSNQHLSTPFTSNFQMSTLSIQQREVDMTDLHSELVKLVWTAKWSLNTTYLLYVKEKKYHDHIVKVHFTTLD